MASSQDCVANEARNHRIFINKLFGGIRRVNPIMVQVDAQSSGWLFLPPRKSFASKGSII
jgi:hypothetical protein